LHATQSGIHWKTTREHDPWWIKIIFANNFKTPALMDKQGGTDDWKSGF
jgi:hypothetical protein